ncbi:MAG: hypothetical protein IJ697_08440 [Synergistaceae bacterium]|nr:hypothetical protein [Synergistaceae bacterium]
MKKLLALVVTIAMLSIAGTAMATVSVDKTAVNITVGSSATVTVTLSADKGGDFDDDPVVDVTWGTITEATSGGYTLTLSPTSEVASGTYDVTVSALEAYTDDTVSHGSAYLPSERTIKVTVTNANEKKAEYPAAPASGTVTNVVVINVNVAALPTFAQIKSTPATRSLVTTAKTFVTSLLSKALNVSISPTAAVLDENDIEEYESENYKVGDNAGNMQKAAAKLKLADGNNSKKAAIGVNPPFTAKKNGFQSMPTKANKAFKGKKLGMYMGAFKPSVLVGGFSAAADTGVSSDVVFLNASGDVVTEVPESGDLTAVAYVEEGVVYEPVLYVDDVTSSDLKAAGISFDEVAEVKVVDEAVAVLPKNASDAKVLELVGLGYVSSADYVTLTRSAFSGDVPSMTIDEDDTDTATASIKLKFDVKKWILYINNTLANTADFVEFDAADDRGLLERGATSKDATVTIYRDQIATGTSVAVSFGVVPTGASDDIDPLRYSLGTVTGTKKDVTISGVGSASGGCSAASAVLALAVLGSFIFTRKK